MLRFSDAHRRDDYRSASAMAMRELAAGGRVWWTADSLTAAYYGLDPVRQAGVTYWMNATPADLAQKPEPDRIFISKKAIYDQGNAMEQYILSHRFVRCASFPNTGSPRSTCASTPRTNPAAAGSPVTR